MDHADRIASALGKQQVAIIRVCGRERFSFGRCGNDLHRVEAIELVDRLDLDRRRFREQLPDLLRNRPLILGAPSRFQTMPAQPLRLRGLFRLGVVDGRVVAASRAHPGHVIDEVVAGNSNGLEDDVAVLAIDVGPGQVFDPRPGRCVDDDDVLVLGVEVAAAPGDAHPDGIRKSSAPVSRVPDPGGHGLGPSSLGSFTLSLHPYHGTVVAEAVGIPFPCGVGDLRQGAHRRAGTGALVDLVCNAEIVGRVGGRDRGIYRLAPLSHGRAKLLGLPRHLFGQVVTLADVLPQVVELEPAILEELDELVVAPADHSHRFGAPGPRHAWRCLAVEREMPKEVSCTDRTAAIENGHEIDAVEDLVRRRIDTRYGQQGRIEIGTDHRNGRRAPRRHPPGPAHDQRHPDAALI